MVNPVRCSNTDPGRLVNGENSLDFIADYPNPRKPKGYMMNDDAIEPLYARTVML